MEQCRMNSQQLAQNAHDAVPLGNLQSPFHHFPEILDGSKVPEALHSLPSYVQQQYAPDSGASLEGGGPPSLPYHLPERPQQGHPHLNPSSSLQQHQPDPTAAYPSFTHEHKGPHPTPHGCSHQHSRASEHSTQIPIGPRSINAFPDNASTRPTSLHGVISPVYGPPYALYSQPPYHPPPTHRSEPTHAPLEQPQPTTTPGPPTLHDQHEDREITVHGQRPRSWGGVGWLDPATRVYCGPPDHTQPPIRTKQACEKCRDRKAKCSGEHPTCQRCHERRLECKYAPERRMRGPNKPKPLLSMSDGSPQPAVAKGQKTRKRAVTFPTVQNQRQQQQQEQSQRQEQAVIITTAPAPAAFAAAASPAPSASGSLGYLPLSESEASPMTPHSSIDSRHSTSVSFPVSPRILIQEFSASTPGMLSQFNGGNRYYDQGGDHGGGVATEGMATGVGTYGHDIFSDLNSRLFDNPKTF